jgi:hypothetical protein
VLVKIFYPVLDWLIGSKFQYFLGFLKGQEKVFKKDCKKWKIKKTFLLGKL